MKCLSDLQIQEYISKNNGTLARSIQRDHLQRCPDCRRRLRQFQALEKALAEPVWHEAPDSIIKTVMARLPQANRPPYAAIASLLAASFLLLVTWIYSYFDLASNSLVRVLQNTSESTFSWFFSLLRLISDVFSLLHAAFKIAGHLLAALPGIGPLKGELALLLGIILALSLFSVQQYKSRKFKEMRK